MNKSTNKIIPFLTLALITLLLPHSVLASTVYVDTNHTDFFVGDTILFHVRINSEGEDINTVEGKILLDYLANAVLLTELNTAGSEFSLWPNKPFPSEDNTNISFVGGAPGGLVSSNAIFFNFVLKLQEPGQLLFSPNNIGVYLNDGKGTKDEVRIKDLAINVLSKESDAQPTDDWDTVISNDTTAPESFEITLGKDPSIFDNQYFIGFFTTDTESGVAYYEVKEGAGDFVRAESPYVLQDQSLQNVITVKAVDRSGNERTETLMPRTPTALSYKHILFGIVACIILIILFHMYRRRLLKKIRK